MLLNDILAGIDILKNHYAVPNWFHMEAEHDMIYMSATDEPLLQANVERLHQLGWCQEGVELPDYEPTEPWVAYT
jgi:hypothetical protein